MMDQAEELRNVIKKQNQSNKVSTARIITDHKWKGRCGKIQHCRKSCSPVSADGVEKRSFLMQISDLQTWK